MGLNSCNFLREAAALPLGSSLQSPSRDKRHKDTLPDLTAPAFPNPPTPFQQLGTANYTSHVSLLLVSTFKHIFLLVCVYNIDVQYLISKTKNQTRTKQKPQRKKTNTVTYV